MKKRLLAILLAALVICSLPQALAAEKPVIAFSLSGDGDAGSLPIDAVMTYTNEKSKVYVFLPGVWTDREVHLWFTSETEATFGGEKVHSGDTVRITSPRVTMKIGRRTYELNIMWGSFIPVLFIRTETGSLSRIEASKEYKEAGEMLMLGGDGREEYSGALKYIKMRGNMSTRFPKKNYGIKLESGKNLLGFGKAKRWVLTGNARDHSLLRSQITFEMARYAGLAYTPECAQVDLYINHEYRGTYLFSEKIEINGGRIETENLEDATADVNGADPETYPQVGPEKASEGRFKAWDIPADPEDITGGYLVEFEEYASRYAEEASAYMTLKSNILVVKSPEYASVAQMNYITGLMQSFENAIFAPDGIDPGTGLHFSEIADMDSMAMKFMVEEISKNYDGSSSSQFFYKKPDRVSTLLFAGPVWDYDSSYGSYAHKGGEALLKPTGFSQTYITSKNDWWGRLYRHDLFKAHVSLMWREHMRPAMRILAGEAPAENGLYSIETYAAAIESSAAMNFIRWPMRSSTDNIADTGRTFRANIDFLTGFVSKRCAWLDRQWGEAK